jgi:hypothetical protein
MISQSPFSRQILSCALFLISVLPASAALANPPSQTPTQAQEDGWAAIKIDDGLLFVWNVKEAHFTLALKGKEIKPLDDPNHIFFSVDGMVFQIQMASLNEFAKDAKARKLDDRAVLAAHRQWEVAYLEDLLKTKLTISNFNVRLTNGNDASLWQFDMPASANAEATKQIYLTAVSQDYVLLLNVAVTPTVSEEAARKYLLDTMATVKTSATTIDVQKLAAAIRNGAKP